MTKALGEVFLYDEGFGMAAFEFGIQAGVTESCRSRAVVCIGGLTDGLLSLRYLPMLAEALEQDRWRVVQPMLSSSYRGWGTGSLDEDAAELDKLLAHLNKERGIMEVALLGHSTGCQDVVRYLAVGKYTALVRAVILQAPVSDREALPLTSSGPSSELEASLRTFRGIATAMIAEGRGNEVMPRAASDLLGPPHAVTAYRFDSLTGRMTDDDMFSSDLTDSELRAKLGHVVVPALLVVSVDDEYVPKTVDSRVLAQRMAGAMGAAFGGLAEVLPIDQAGHALKTDAAKSTFVRGVGSFLRRLAGGRADGAENLTWQWGAVEDIRRRAASAPSPFMVAIAGVPGAGKSHAAGILERALGPSCFVVSMDGFHLPLASLRERPDAEDAVYRRGAPDTFDAGSLRDKLQEISGRSSGCSPDEVPMPGFDHSVGDPVEGATKFIRSVHHIVIVEGLYLLHDGDGWEGIADLFDFRIYLDTDLDVAMEVLKDRNKVIPGYTAEQIAARCERVDRENAFLVKTTMCRADIIVSDGRGSVGAAAG